MARIVGIALALVALAGFGLFAGACSDDGGDTLTLEEFLREVGVLDEEFEERSGELDDELNAIDESTTVDEAADLFDQQVDLIDEFINDLDDLNEPDEASATKSEAVAAGNEVVEQFRSAIDEGRDSAETIDDFGSIFESDELNAAFERFDQACLDAQQLADDNDIDVQLNC